MLHTRLRKRLFVGVVALAAGCRPAAGPALPAPRPGGGAGLIVELSDGQRRLTTVQRAPHFALNADESLHPAVGSAFTAVWTGKLRVLEAGRYRFGAPGARLALDGRPVGGEVSLAAGEHPLRIEYRRPPGPARLQLTWASDQFAEEPVPPAAFRHDARPAAAERGALADRGRVLAVELGCHGCHGGAPAPLGPRLDDVGARVSPRWLHHWLGDPRRVRPGAAMPALLDDNERRDVAAFLSRQGNAPAPITATAETAARGEALFETIGCTACHGDGGVPLGAVGAKWTVAALAAYLKDPLAVAPAGRMPSMLLDDREALSLAAHLSRARDPALEQAPGGGDPARGRELVRARGCLNCHTSKDERLTLAAPALGALRPGRGCLSAAPAAPAARYDLPDEQRRALDAFVATPDVAPSPHARFDALVATLRCNQCHEVDGPARVRFEEVPPALTDTGNKLRTGWLRQVLAERRRVRPWMTLRMPHFGEAAGALAPLFAAVSGAAPGDGPPTPVPDAIAVREGVRALGRGEEGLACINCHDLGPHVSQGGTRGPDMTTIIDRIRGDLFRRWMLAPARIQPGTQMPAFFAGVAPDVTERRIQHLWGALSLGAGLPRPEGLADPQRHTLAPKDAPVVFRTFMKNASTMTLAVGFPGGQSFAFDAGGCRLQMAWAGEFLDVTPVWVGRGGGEARPLGAVWYSEPREAGLRVGAPEQRPKVRFRGYFVERGAATFSYDLDGREVRERIAPRPDGTGWVRTFSVGPGGGDLWFVSRPGPGVRVQASAGPLDAQGRLRLPRAAEETRFTVTITQEARP